MSKRRDPREMRRLIARRRDQGLTWDELSEESGVPKSTLTVWDRRLRSGTKRPPPPVPFVAVEVAAPSRSVSSSVEVVLGNGRRLILQRGFDIVELQRLIDALDS